MGLLLLLLRAPQAGGAQVHSRLSSGAPTLIEVLKLAPGVDVSQQNRSVVIVSIRGFDQQFSNMLLIIVDGRPVFHLAYGGMF